MINVPAVYGTEKTTVAQAQVSQIAYQYVVQFLLFENQKSLRVQHRNEWKVQCNSVNTFKKLKP